MLSGFATERSIGDVLSGRLRLTFGGRVFELPVLSIAANRRWREGLEARLQPIVDASASDDLETIVAALAVAEEDLLDVLLSYDQDHLLPPRDVLEEMARPHELFRAVMDVRAAANPLLGVGLALAAETTPSVSPTSMSSRSTNGRASRTRGRSKPV